MSALVLGLLVASAKGTYDAQNNELLDTSGKVIFLDCIPADYGPDSKEARDDLRIAVEEALTRIWPHEHTQRVQIEGRHGTEVFLNNSATHPARRSATHHESAGHGCRDFITADTLIGSRAAEHFDLHAFTGHIDLLVCD
jgi:hypothetical protein